MNLPTCLKPPIASFKKLIACCSVPIGFSGVPVTVCAAARPPCASIGRNSRSMAAIQQGWVDDDSTLLSPGIFGKISSALLPFADLIPCPFPQPQAFRIGDQLIVSMPFRGAGQNSPKIKEKSPAPRTFLIELANGNSGYLPPPNQVELGGYETWLGASRFEKHSS